MAESSQNPQNLGLVPVPSGTFEFDAGISEMYQSFSAELLRLALLGIGAIGFLITNFVLHKEGAAGAPNVPTNLRLYLMLSLILLGISAACALLHRYFGPDSLAYHVEALRLTIRNTNGDLAKAKHRTKARNRRLKFGARLLLASAAFLWGGAVFLIASLIVAI